MNLQTLEQSIRHNPDYLDCLIDENEAARFIDYSVRTLQNWRVRGGGPAFVKVSSRSIRYRRRDLIEWITAHTVANTSQFGGVDNES